MLDIQRTEWHFIAHLVLSKVYGKPYLTKKNLLKNYTFDEQRLLTKSE